VLLTRIISIFRQANAEKSLGKIKYEQKDYQGALVHYTKAFGQYKIFILKYNFREGLELSQILFSRYND
jgi:hypothetical protein